MRPGTTAASGLDLVAEGIWSRLRELVLAQERWDRFVGEPGEPPPEGGWQATPQEAERVATELVLRTLGRGLEPVNYAILERLLEDEDRTLSLARLTELTGLPRIALTERIHDLAQVGLASYAPEARRVQATALTEGFLGLVADLRDRVVTIMAARSEKP